MNSTTTTVAVQAAPFQEGRVQLEHIQMGQWRGRLQQRISYVYSVDPSAYLVHYCRKHYQRSRYRNPKEYAKLQYALVQQQIRRVHEWSSNNMKSELPELIAQTKINSQYLAEVVPHQSCSTYSA
ncbi:hypothetical protein B0J14DRAFT_315430 [Halenospora varia]|nr:hypothetical protein B0J14DRAFT_315430 [Halenospora varia]